MWPRCRATAAGDLPNTSRLRSSVALQLQSDSAQSSCPHALAHICAKEFKSGAQENTLSKVCRKSATMQITLGDGSDFLFLQLRRRSGGGRRGNCDGFNRKANGMDRESQSTLKRTSCRTFGRRLTLGHRDQNALTLNRKKLATNERTAHPLTNGVQSNLSTFWGSHSDCRKTLSDCSLANTRTETTVINALHHVQDGFLDRATTALAL